MNELPDELFRRADESDDALFYTQPRLVTHIDDATIASLVDFYREFIPSQARVLDLMSSWISHLPEDVSYADVAGLGMNETELRENPRLTQWCVHDLNKNPDLPFAERSFDRVLIAVSIQYLTQPVAVMRSLVNSLSPGGKLCIAMSHRLFPTKAIMGFQALAPKERIQLVGNYLTLGGFIDVEFYDRSPESADPLWIVTGTVP